MTIRLGFALVLLTANLSNLANTEEQPNGTTIETLFSSSATSTYADPPMTAGSTPLECAVGSFSNTSLINSCILSSEECYSVLTCDGEGMGCFSYLYSDPGSDVFNYTFGCTQMDTCQSYTEGLQECSSSLLLVAFSYYSPKMCGTCCDDEDLCNKYFYSSQNWGNENSTPNTSVYPSTTTNNWSEGTPSTVSMETLSTLETAETSMASYELQTGTELLNTSQELPTHLECFTSRISSRTLIEECLSPPYSPECFSSEICSDATMGCYVNAVFNKSGNTFNYTSGCIPLDECHSIKETWTDCTALELRTALLYNLTTSCMTCCDSYERCNNVIPGFLLAENDERCPIGYVFDDVFHTNLCYTATDHLTYNLLGNHVSSINSECNRLGGTFLYNNDTAFLHWLLGKMNLRGESIYLNSNESTVFDAIWYDDATQTIESGYYFSAYRGLCYETKTAATCLYGNMNNESLIQSCITAEPPPHCFTFEQCEDTSQICYTYGNVIPTTNTFNFMSGCLSMDDCQALKGSLDDCGIVGFGFALLFNTEHHCSTCCVGSYCNNLGVLNFLIPGTNPTTSVRNQALESSSSNIPTTAGYTSTTLEEKASTNVRSTPSVSGLSEATVSYTRSIPSTVMIQDGETTIGATSVTDVTSLTQQTLEVTTRDISNVATDTTMIRDSSSSGFASTDTTNTVYPSQSPDGNTTEHRSTSSSSSQRTRQESTSTSVTYSNSAIMDSTFKSSPTVDFSPRATTGLTNASVSTVSSTSPSTSGVFSSETSAITLNKVTSSPTHRGYHRQSNSASNGYSYSSQGFTKAYSTLTASKDGPRTTYSTHSIDTLNATGAKTVDASSTSLSFSEIMSTPQEKEDEYHKSVIFHTDVTTKHMEEVSREPSLYGDCLSRLLWNSIQSNTQIFKYNFNIKEIVGRGVTVSNIRSPKQKHTFNCRKAYESM